MDSLALLPVSFLLASEDVSSVSCPDYQACCLLLALMYSAMVFYHSNRKVTNGYVHVWGYFILHTYDSQLTTHHKGKSGQELEAGALDLFLGLSSASFAYKWSPQCANPSHQPSIKQYHRHAHMLTRWRPSPQWRVPLPSCL